VASGCLQAHGVHESVEIIDDALIKAIELGAPLVLQFRISREGAQQPGGQWRIDPFEQLQEDKADGVASS
jgi:hypothetical protein